jgi:hypothetical protein
MSLLIFKREYLTKYIQLVDADMFEMCFFGGAGLFVLIFLVVFSRI